MTIQVEISNYRVNRTKKTHQIYKALNYVGPRWIPQNSTSEQYIIIIIFLDKIRLKFEAQVV